MKDLIDIVLPVYNESKNLEKRFINLYEFLSKQIEQDWVITIAENGSTDNTLEISKFLQKKYKKCRVISIDEPGKGGGMSVIDQLYSGYGEGAPRGRGPSQSLLGQRGNSYLQSEFPNLDYIKTARVCGEDSTPETATDYCP